jgi:hypothetical protein
VRHHLAAAGRSEDEFGTELILTRARTVAQVVETAERWWDVGGTAVCVVTQKLGLPPAESHIGQLTETKAALDALLSGD